MSNRQRSFRIGLVLVAVIVVAAAWVSRFARGHPAPAEPTKPPTPQAPRSTWYSVASVTSSRTHVDGAAILITAVEEPGGRKIAGVQVVEYPAQARMVPGKAADTSVTDASGVARIARAPNPGHSLYCTRPGYTTAEIRDAALGHSYTVALRRTHTVTILCRSLHNQPVPNVQIDLSRLSVAYSDVPSGERPKTETAGDVFHPGANPRTATYRGRTNGSGVARIGSVPAGHYSLYALHRDYAPVDLNYDHAFFPVPSRPARAVFALILASAWKCRRDGAIVSRQRRYEPAPVSVQSSLPLAALRAVRKQLERRFPAYEVDVQLGRSESIICTRTVFIPGLGEGTATHELLPAQQIDARVVDAVDFHGDALAGRVHLHISDPALRESIEELRLISTDGKYAIVPRMSHMSVPPGDYRISCLDQYLRDILPRNGLTVPLGGVVDVNLDLPVALTRVTVRVKSKDGGSGGHVSLHLSADGVRIEQRAFLASDPPTLLLAPGHYQVRCICFGYKPFLGTLNTRVPNRVAALNIELVHN